MSTIPRTPADTRPPGHTSHTREGVTRLKRSVTLSRVRGVWEPREFAAYLDQIMVAEGVPNDAALAVRAGVRQTQIGNWRAGKNRPSTDLLDRMAERLGVPSANLYRHAGYWTPADDEPLALAVPPAFRDLIAIYNDPHTSPEDRDLIIDRVKRITGAIRTLSAEPSRRRSQPRRAG